MPTPSPDRCLPRALVVEDAHHVRSMLCDLLAAWGWQADGVPNATEGLEHFERRGYDLLLTDFRMTDMTGLDLVERVRARDAELPVIMLTASSVDLVPACRRLRVTLLYKPVEIARLRSALPPLHDDSPYAVPVAAVLTVGVDRP